MNDGILLSYQKGLNFWDLHPYWLKNKTVNQFYQRDRSQENGKTTKHKSSQIMWALCLLYDLGTSNIYRHLPIDNRRQKIAEEILENPKFDWDEYKDLESIVEERCTTPQEKHYHTLMEKFNQRDKFVRNTDYSLDQYVEINGKNVLIKGTADQLEKMLANTDKIYETLETIRKKITMDKSSKTGQKTNSETQEGLI